MSPSNFSIQNTTVKKILLQLLLLVLLLTACRLIFHLLNYHTFPEQSFFHTLSTYITGIRFDLSTIIYFTLPCLFFSCVIDIFFPEKKILRYLNDILFLVIGSFILLVNLIDAAYFKFISNRSSYETLLMVNDSKGAFVTYLKKFWYIISLSAIIIAVFIWGNKLIIKYVTKTKPLTVNNLRFYVEYAAVSVLLFVLGRGLNTFPLTPGSANLYVKPAYVSLVNNSAFNILFSLIKHDHNIPVPDFSGLDEKRIVFTPYQRFSKDSSFQKRNVVIFILESFSPSYLSPGHPYKAHTPFLDSIMKKSLVCTNAFSNGAMSINGINSIIGSIPPIAYLTIINSPYQNNVRRNIGTVFEEQGYSTHFFFGSNDDHYGFKRLIRQFGITNYYGEKEFNNNKYHDKVWGISDMPFMGYAAAVLNAQKAPFLSVIFNLSSHYPFTVPEPYKTILPKGPLNSSQSISYVDKSLEAFFDTVKHQSWFMNSLFVFVADHQSYGDETRTFGVNGYSIPMFYYTPDGYLKPGKFGHITDHLGIFPSILDILNFSGPFVSHGKSIFDTSAKSFFSCSIAHYPDVVQITNDSLNLQFDIRSNEKKQLFLYKKDPELKNNILDSSAYHENAIKMEQQLKEYLYSYYKGIQSIR